MAAHPITHEQDTIETEIHIAAPPERVFQALTDPQQLLQWWGQQGIYRGTRWNTDVRPGGKWRSEGVSDRDGNPFHVEGEYLQVDPPRLLEYTWIASWTGSIKTIVRMELEAKSGGTMLRLRHTGFTEAAHIKGHSEGWQRVMGWLQAFVEKGQTVATRLSA